MGFAKLLPAVCVIAQNGIIQIKAAVKKMFFNLFFIRIFYMLIYLYFTNANRILTPNAITLTLSVMKGSALLVVKFAGSEEE